MNSSSGLASTSRTKTNQNIQVYVRVRPLNAREKSIRSLEVVDVPSSREVVVRQMFDTKTTKKFTFDRTFDPHSKQPEVYHSVVAPLIEEVLAGYNCTVFAYGQTGTGKTHTMVGTECPEMKSSWEDDSMIGIIPRALTHLFDELRLMEVEFSMRVSYLELYNEELCDLLSTDDDVKIRIFDDASKKGSVIIQGLEEITVHTKDDVYKLLKKGQERRKTATTLMNAQSSRSHTVFSILVHIKENGMDGEELLKIGKLNLVDLAGSENISKAGNEKGIRARETVNINQSLLTLGRVITALVERTPHIPYRESKLTRLLQESLGGRTKTSIIATISPGHKDLEETLSTLEYAHRAKNIQNRPELNQKLTKKTVIKEYTEEIDRLKRDLMAARDKNGIYLAEETYIDMHSKLESQNKELNEKVLLLKALKDELANKESIFNEVSLHLVEKSEQLKKTENVLVTTKSELDQTKRVLTTTKRRYKEKKLLVDTHLKTEVELTNQATQLIEVADIATTDTSKLHNTIERRKNVDQKIKLTCDQFASNCQQTFDKMDESLENLLATHSSHSEVILDDIATNIKQHDTFSTSIKDGLSKIDQYQNAWRDDMAETFQKYLTLLNGSNVEYEKLFLALFSEWNATENKNRQKMDDLVIQMLNSLNEQNRLLAEKCCHSRKFIETQNENVVNYVNSATNALEQLSVDVKSYMANSVQDIEATSSKLSDLSKKEFDIITALKESLENLSLVRAEKCQVESHLNQISENLNETEKNVNSSVKSQSKSAKQFVNEFTSQQKMAQDRIVATEGEVSVLSKQWNEHIDDLKATNCDYHEKSIVTINEIQKTTGDCRDKLEETGEIIKKEFADKQEKSQEALTTYNKEAVDMISSEHMRLKLYATQSSAFNKMMQHNIAEYANTYRGQITQCRQEVHNFHTNELKTYTPSGETPSKKEFSYPRILAATSPHDRIIKRFRMENDWSDLDTTSPITEDSEITLHDLTDDQIMVNSTPLKPKTGNDNLKVFPREFNFKIPSSKTNSPALFECSPPEENKENSGIKLEP